MEGDGHCFYRCLAQCLKSDPEMREEMGAAGLDELQTVRVLRHAVGQALRRRPKVRRWLADLLELANEAPCVVEEYPCLRAPGGTSVGDHIWKSAVWASAFEVDVLREILRPFRISLVVTCCADRADLMEDTVVERQVHEALSRRRATRARRRSIVLVRLGGEEHYMFCSLDARGVIEDRDLLECVSEYLD